VPAADAATVWKKQFEPLKRDFGVKLGAPAVTGSPGGFTWLTNWLDACSSISNDSTSCQFDFIPVHWVRHLFPPSKATKEKARNKRTDKRGK